MSRVFDLSCPLVFEVYLPNDGNDGDQGGESHDRETISLPAVEAEMLKAVANSCQSSRRRQRLNASDAGV